MNKKLDTNADLLRTRMIDRYGSIRQFAIATGIERTQVYPILRGESLPGLENFVTMATSLDLTLDHLANLLGVDPRTELRP
jgi:transcriptional regulator with XRE-family HTH domain